MLRIKKGMSLLFSPKYFILYDPFCEAWQEHKDFRAEEEGGIGRNPTYVATSSFLFRCPSLRSWRGAYGGTRRDGSEMYSWLSIQAAQWVNWRK